MVVISGDFITSASLFYCLNTAHPESPCGMKSLLDKAFCCKQIIDPAVTEGFGLVEWNFQVLLKSLEMERISFD